MRYTPEFFSLDELVCPHVHKKFGDVAWSFLDPRLLMTLDNIRMRLNKPVWVNNWSVGGQFDERGFRCIQCDLVKSAISAGRLYVSPHMTGQGADFDVEGMTADEVRQWIIKHENLLPYCVRLEDGVNWVHLDVRDTNRGKVVLFSP